MLDQLVEIVRRAGDLIRDAHDMEAAAHEKSSAADIVTKYDVAVQAFLKRELLTLVPDADFLGEEGEHDSLTKPWVFVVDPIDGTANFVRNMLVSNIAVALVHEGVVEYGVVYNPFSEEMFYAKRGGGAFKNGRPIHASDRDMSHALILCGSTPYDRSFNDRSFSLMRQLYDLGLDFRRFGAAELDLCYIACGRAEVFYECRLGPWDYAAGSVILTEAGGSITRLDGTPVDPYHSGSVWATNGICHDTLKLLKQ